MRVLEGKSVFSGIAIGKISILQKADTSVKRTKVENPEAEITRVQEAKKAVEQLQKLYDKALREVGESGAAIFEVHQMMLDDEDYLDSIDNIIRTENVNAEHAVATTGDNFADMFAQMDDDYMKARAADIKDISDRLVRVLSGHDEEIWMLQNHLLSLLRIWLQVKLYRWTRAKFLHLLQGKVLPIPIQQSLQEL